jgi:hypothetical protein
VGTAQAPPLGSSARRRLESDGAAAFKSI